MERYYAGVVRWDRVGSGTLEHVFTLDDEQKQVKVMGNSKEEVKNILATEALYVHTLGTRRLIPFRKSSGLIIWQEA